MKPGMQGCDVMLNGTVFVFVFHKMFHQVFLQLLFILSWKLALRGHFKISKKKKNIRVMVRAYSELV